MKFLRDIDIKNLTKEYNNYKPEVLKQYCAQVIVALRIRGQNPTSSLEEYSILVDRRYVSIPLIKEIHQLSSHEVDKKIASYEALLSNKTKNRLGFYKKMM
jgi:hypothetical protein